MTRRLSALALALGLSACGAPDVPIRPYMSNDLVLLPGHTAKAACECVFIHERPEAECKTWVRANPPIAMWTVDTTAKTVTAAVAVFWGKQARFVDDQVGCEFVE